MLTLAGRAGPALAHDSLASTSPTAGSTVSASLHTVSVTFAERPLAEFTSALALRVIGPTGKPVTAGKVTVSGNTLSIKVNPTAQGTQTVTWQSVSSDGHPVTGTFTFTYNGPIAAPTPSSTPQATATSTAAPHETDPASATPAAAGGKTNHFSLTLELIGAGLLMAIVAGVIVFMLRRSGGTAPTP